jgi:hypothetical protein
MRQRTEIRSSRMERRGISSKPEQQPAVIRTLASRGVTATMDEASQAECGEWRVRGQRTKGEGKFSISATLSRNSNRQVAQAQVAAGSITVYYTDRSSRSASVTVLPASELPGKKNGAGLGGGCPGPRPMSSATIHRQDLWLALGGAAKDWASTDGESSYALVHARASLDYASSESSYYHHHAWISIL